MTEKLSIVQSFRITITEIFPWGYKDNAHR